MARGPRYVFFTNECVGLGHLRRTFALARATADHRPSTSALVVTGSAAVSGYPLPPRVDTVKLPVLARDGHGLHSARTLAVGLDDIHRVRSGIAVGAVDAFEPDVVVVDKTPLGLNGELMPVLDRLREMGSRVVLGLRDIDDSQEAVMRAWSGRLTIDAIRHYYDAVLVYGPESGIDALACLGVDDLGIPVHHVGYVGTAVPEQLPTDLPDGYMLITPGGGADGFALLRDVVAAMRMSPLPCPAVMVTGPLMPERQVRALRDLAQGLPLTIHVFRADMEAVIAGARCIVAMAGYNTVSELIGTGRPALLAPRGGPSGEQLVRAESLAARGVVDLLRPEHRTPATLRAAIGRLLNDRAPMAPVVHDGAARAARILSRLAEPALAAA